MPALAYSATEHFRCRKELCLGQTGYAVVYCNITIIFKGHSHVSSHGNGDNCCIQGHIVRLCIFMSCWSKL